MNLFTLVAQLKLNSDEYQTGIQRAENSTGGFSNTIKKLAIPAAIGAIGAKSTEVGMTFEASMS